jgi:hypothetical protein
VALADPLTPEAAFVAGGMAEESLLVLQAFPGASSTNVGTAAVSQAASVLLMAEGALIGPELYQASSDLRATGHDRTGVLASNRLILAVTAVLLLGSAAALVAGVDLAGTLAGR